MHHAGPPSGRRRTRPCSPPAVCRLSAADALGIFVIIRAHPTRPFCGNWGSMLSEWELWACAQHYVKRHGEDAAVMAAFRCDELLAAGDTEGVRH
jgi:hypothetical protein